MPRQTQGRVVVCLFGRVSSVMVLPYPYWAIVCLLLPHPYLALAGRVSSIYSAVCAGANLTVLPPAHAHQLTITGRCSKMVANMLRIRSSRLYVNPGFNQCAALSYAS